MEDRVLAVCPFLIANTNNGNNSIGSSNNEMMGLFGICDGHGGSFVSQFLVDEMPALVQQELQMASGKGPERLHMALMSSCLSAEKKLQEHPRMAVDLKPVKGVVFNPESGQPLNPKPADSSGSTGLFCLVTPSMFVIANVGDSRAVVAKSNITAAEASKAAAAAVPESTARISSPFGHSLASNSSSNDNNNNDSGASVVELKWASVDHKCSNEGEKARIEAAGLTVATHATSGGSQMKIGGETISMSRSFADFTFKQSCSLQMYEQALVAVPDVHVFERSNEDAFVVLACDGVYDVMSNEEVVAFFAEKLGYISGTEPVAFVSPLASRTSYSVPQRGGIAAGARGTSQVATTAACDALLKECLKRGSGDNMSVLLILLGEPPVQATATPHASVSVPVVPVPAAAVETTSGTATVTSNDTADGVVPRRSDTTPMRALPPPPPITLSPSVPPSLETAKQLQF
jgi:serine/threonine protein phosphatase PrpC